MLIIYVSCQKRRTRAKEWQFKLTLFGNGGSRGSIVVGSRAEGKNGGNHSLVVWSNVWILTTESSAMIQSRKVKEKKRLKTSESQ